MRLLLSLSLIVICLLTRAQTFPEPLIPKRLVNDYTSLLGEAQQIDLNNRLLEFNNQTSTQIFVVTWDDLQGYDIADYGDRMGEAWGIGQKGSDNGILVLVSPASRQVTIRVGYGLEGAVPDALAKRLIEQVIIPGFRTGEYYGGLDSTATVLMALTRGEFTAGDYMKKQEEGGFPLSSILILLVLFFIFSGILRKRRNYFSPTCSIPWWMIGTGVAGGSNWGSFRSGGGSFGGFGGFGGGGGGSFGGGGASGSW